MGKPRKDKGGQGGRLPISREELRLLRRATRQRWGVPDEYQTEAMFAIGEILTRTEAADRDRLAAVKTLVEMTKIDQKDEQGEGREQLTYDDIPDDEPDVEPRDGEAQAGMPDGPGEV